MHQRAMKHADVFFRQYVEKSPSRIKIVEIGSMNVNGSLRDVAPQSAEYVGLDFEHGNGVDLILQDPYHFPVEEATADIVVSSSCFEHAQFFWLTFLEVLRILKPTGVFYLNVPVNGFYHRHPLDSWRFYPDAGLTLSAWARRNGYPSVLLESFVGGHDVDGWRDFVAVFLRDGAHAARYGSRMHPQLADATNILTEGEQVPQRFAQFSADVRPWRLLLNRVKAGPGGWLARARG